MSMACLRVRDLLPEFALDVLDPSDAGQVEVHLETCPACRKEAEGFREGAVRFALMVPEATPAPSLGERVAQRVASASRERATPRSRREASRRTLRAVAAAGLAAAILAAGSFTWALAMRDQVEKQQSVIDQRAATVAKLRRFIADFQQNVHIVSPVDKRQFLGALLTSPSTDGSSGELLVFGLPGNQTGAFVHMQANLPPSAKGPFRVLFQQRDGPEIKAGGLVKTPNGDYVLSPKDPRFFDVDLSHMTGVIVLDRTGATLLTGAIQLITNVSS